MKLRTLKAVGLAMVGSLVMAAGAQAAPTADANVTITPQGNLYKQAKKPVNLGMGATITPSVGSTTLTALLSANFTLPSDLSFVPDPNMKVCTAITEQNSNFPPETAIQQCPNSVIGDGTAKLFLAQQVAAPINDPVITIFNGGKTSDGSGILSIQAYSASTNHGIFMSGALKNGKLDVSIPRLTGDSSVPALQLNIPGDIGQTKSYAQATCSSGSWTSSATFDLGNRDAGGNVSNTSTLTSAPKSTPCTGLAGTAKVNKVSVSGPSKVKKGKKATYKVKITNTGTATAKSVRLKVSGKGLAFNTSVGSISPSKTRTLNVKVKAKKKGKVKASFKVTSSNGGGKTVKKTVTVK